MAAIILPVARLGESQSYGRASYDAATCTQRQRIPETRNETSRAPLALVRALEKRRRVTRLVSPPKRKGMGIREMLNCPEKGKRTNPEYLHINPSEGFINNTSKKPAETFENEGERIETTGTKNYLKTGDQTLRSSN